MAEPRRGRGQPAGLTIMEVLVVLIIFGIGWFAVLPNLGLLDAMRTTDPGLDRLNAFLAQARSQAMGNGTMARMVVVPGKKTLSWEGVETIFPAAVSRCLVNGRQHFDRPTEFRVYPTGAMDDVRITLDGGAVLSSNVLGAEFLAAK